MIDDLSDSTCYCFLLHSKGGRGGLCAGELLRKLQPALPAQSQCNGIVGDERPALRFDGMVHCA